MVKVKNCCRLFIPRANNALRPKGDGIAVPIGSNNKDLLEKITFFRKSDMLLSKFTEARVECYLLQAKVTHLSNVTVTLLFSYFPND